MAVVIASLQSSFGGIMVFTLIRRKSIEFAGKMASFLSNDQDTQGRLGELRLTVK
jgi:hypothetical protein